MEMGRKHREPEKAREKHSDPTPPYPMEATF